MSTTLNFKDVIDKPSWRPVSPAIAACTAGSSICGDHRNNEDRHPKLFEITSATTVYRYNVKNDGWTQIASPALAGTFGAGANSVFCPHRGPRGTLTGTPTSTTFALSTLETLGGTALTAVQNDWADRGSGTQGFKIRIISKANGATFDTYVQSNSAGTTPTVTVYPACPWTPASGDAYEFLSGRLYLISAGTTAAGVWKCLDVLTGQWSGNLSTTNLPGTLASTDSSLICLDELYVPSNLNPGDGFFGNITATGAAAGTITGAASGLESTVLANEFRNFQIRIVSDATNKTSVGQRLRIASHTGGPSAVYTMCANWTVQPSSSAVFVIEGPNDIIYSANQQTTTYTYFTDTTPGLNSGASTADSWSNSMYAARGTACGAGTEMFWAHGVSNAIVAGVTTEALYGAMDPNKNFRYSYLFSARGGNGNVWDILDIAGAANGAWTNAAPFDQATGLNYFNTGTASVYEASSMNGQFAYVNYIGSQQFNRVNLFARSFDEWAYLRYPAGGTQTAGHRMATSIFCDPSGSPKVGFIYSRRYSAATTGASTEMFESLISR